ncbi:hypothetical protein D3C77_458660 [compost metagenome]
MPPIAKTAYSQRPFSLNTFLTDPKNSLNLTGSLCSGSFTIVITRINEIRHKIGIARKGAYHIHAPSKAPRIGLNTLPNVFDVSIIPKP